MRDTRTLLNVMRKMHSTVLITENIDDTTKNSIYNMFKTSVDETVNLEAVNLNEQTFKASGIITLEIRFDITINNNDNETICNIWFVDNTIELTEFIVSVISKLYSFFNIELKEYVRENII